MKILSRFITRERLRAASSSLPPGACPFLSPEPCPRTGRGATKPEGCTWPHGASARVPLSSSPAAHRKWKPTAEVASAFLIKSGDSGVCAVRQFSPPQLHQSQRGWRFWPIFLILRSQSKPIEGEDMGHASDFRSMC